MSFVMNPISAFLRCSLKPIRSSMYSTILYRDDQEVVHETVLCRFSIVTSEQGCKRVDTGLCDNVLFDQYQSKRLMLLVFWIHSIIYQLTV